MGRGFFKQVLILALTLAVGAGSAPRAWAHASDRQAEAKEAPAGPGEGLKYINMDPLTLPVVDATGVVSNISIAIALECEEKNSDDIKKQMPVLTDAYIQNLYGSLNKHDALKDGVLQVALIKDRLTTITNKVLDKGQVKSVLLQVVQQRPI